MLDDFDKIEYEYEDPIATNTSFDIELLNGSDAKPGNVKFMPEYMR